MPWLPARRDARSPGRSRSAARTWAPRVEFLEIRALMHGDEIHDVADDPTATHLVLQHDTIPNFARNPTHVAVASGDWSSTSTWAGGQRPGTGAIVQIATGVTVTVSTVNDTAIGAIGVNPGGKLQFATNVNTRLTVGTMIVFQGGTLQIGTATAPIATNVKAELVIADRPLDLVNDPRQYGTGLIVAGKIEIAGSPIAKTNIRMVRELRAGATFIEIPTGSASDWKPGDQILLPDTRQVPATVAESVNVGDDSQYPPQWEVVTIASVTSNRINLTAPLQYDHLGGRNGDGMIEVTPHVALLDRNVIVRSANPNGTRGHTLYGLRADVNIQYARFKDLGRTTAWLPLDNTTFDMHGNVTHVGTNQIGRYSVHIHHLLGPENSTGKGYQFRFVGNTIDHGRKWGLAIHGSSYGLVSANVIYNVEGSGIATEDGTELYNEITRNFIMRVVGNGESPELGTEASVNDTGRGGVGIWMRRAGNIVKDNIIANATFGGISYSSKLLNDVTVGTFRGADPRLEEESQLLISSPSGVLSGNEVYGRTFNGVWLEWPHNYRLTFPAEPLVIDAQRVWNTHGEAIFASFVDQVVIRGAHLLGDRAALAQNVPGRGPVGINFASHSSNNVTVESSRIEGFKYGIRTPPDDAGTADVIGSLVRDTTLKNYVNVVVATTKGDGKHLELRNIQFRTLPVAALPDQAPLHVLMNYTGDGGQLTATDVVRIVDMNGDPNADYRLYYAQQAADFVVPVSSPGVTGAPVPGLTNLQLWQQYGLAIGGAVAPTSGQVNISGTNGLAFPLDVRADVQGPAQLIRGVPQTFTLTAQDSSAAFPGEFTWSIDWDANGSVDETVVGSSGMTVDHIFEGVGTVNVRVSAKNRNGDGGVVSTTRSFPVVGYRVVEVPSMPGVRLLEWTGTSGTDQITVVANGNGVVLTELMLNGVATLQTYSIPDVQVVSIVALAGNDWIDTTLVGSSRRVSLLGDDGNDIMFAGGNTAYLEGGAGNDILVGTSTADFLSGLEGHDVLVGLGGDDWLMGDTGRDILFGGDGADNLDADGSEDILLAGLNSYADLAAGLNISALSAISSEWRSSRTYAERVANIIGTGTGPRNNGQFTLTAGVTVFFDDDRDTLGGGSSSDWLLLSTTAELFNGAPIPTDSISGTDASEVRTNTPHKPPGW